MSKINMQMRKSQELRTLKNFIFSLLKDFIPFEWSNKEQCYNMVSGYPSKWDKDIHVHETLQVQPREYKEKNPDHRIQNLLQWFRDELLTKGYSEHLIYRAAKFIINRQLFQFIDYGNKDYMMIEPNAKGNSRYNKKQSGRILDRLREFGAQNMDCIFLTQTCDPSKYKSIGDAWENFYKKEVEPVWEPLRKYHSAVKVSVMESTKKGYPHIHNLIFFPKGKFQELSKLKNGTKLKFGRLYNFIRDRVYSRIFDIKTVSGQHKIFYLTKYLRKGIENPVRNILQKNFSDLDKSEIKLLNEFVFLTAYGKRKILMSQSKTAKQSQKISQDKASVLDKSCNEVANSDATKLRTLLNSICVNSSLSRTCTIWNVSYKNVIETIKTANFREDITKEEFFEHFRSLATSTINTENFYTLLVKFVQNPYSSPLNKAFYVKGHSNKVYRFTDFFDLNNDEDYINCIKHLIVYYWEYCVKYELPIKDIMEKYAVCTPVGNQINVAYSEIEFEYKREDIGDIVSYKKAYLKEKHDAMQQYYYATHGSCKKN